MKRMAFWIACLSCLAVAAVAQPGPSGADLFISLTGSYVATAGENAIYSVEVVNQGPATASNVSFSLPVPAGMTLVSNQQTVGPAFTCSNGASIVCTLPSMPSSTESDFALTFQIASGYVNASIVATATVTSATPDPAPQNNSSQATISVSTLASLTITKTAAPSVNAGSNLSYTIALTSDGPSDALNASVSDPLPSGTTFVSMTETSGPAASCIKPAVGAAGTVSCSILKFAAGQTATFSLVVKVDPAAAPGAQISNTATASTTTPIASEVGNPTGTAVTAVATSADLSVTKTGPALALPGQNTTYTVKVTNNGPSVAGSITVTDTTPQGLTFVSNAGDCATAYPCTFQSLAPGQSVTITGTYTLSSTLTGSISNTASASSEMTPDPVPANNHSTAITNLAQPLTCSARATGVPVRSEGTRELVADVVVTCTGGIPTPAGVLIPTDSVTLRFNSNVTSRILDASSLASEALALIDEPQPGAQFPCAPFAECPAYGNGTGTGYYGGGTSTPNSPANRNVFQGLVGVPYGETSSVDLHTITWFGLPVDSPGSGTRTYRFTNIRLDATGVDGPLQLTGILTNGTLPVQLGEAPLTLATPQTSLSASVRDASDTVPVPSGVTLPVSPQGLVPTRFATLRLAAAYPGADKPRTIAAFVNPNVSPAPANQNVPGQRYNSESGFFNSAFGPNGDGGNLGLAGLADSGTRYMATFTNIPAGMTLYVDIYGTGSNGSVARLVSTDGNGAGPFSATGSGSIAPLTVANGTAVAVWEVLKNSTQSADQFDFGVYLSSVSGIYQPPPPIHVQLQYAPVTPAQSIPLFAGSPVSQTLLTFVAPPQLLVSPGSLSFSGTAGGANPPPQDILVTSSSEVVPLAFTLAGNSLSYSFQPPSAGTPARIAISPNTTGLRAGTYQDVITLTGGAGTTVSQIFVTLTLGPGPQITSVTPAVVSAGGPSFTLTVDGLNLVPGTVVQWNGTALQTTSSSTTELKASVPATLILKPATAQITALTPDQARSNSLPVAVVLPQLTSISPSTVVAGSADFVLTLAGTGFLPGATVSIGGSSVTPSSVSTTQITATVPAALVATPGSLAVLVVNPGNNQSNALPLTVINFHLTSLSPAAITAGGPDFILTLNGDGFAQGAHVTVGGTVLTPSAISAGQITVTVPAAVIAHAGSLAVTVTNPGNLVSNALPLAVNGAPAISALSPSSATAGNPGLTLTVTGTGFTSRPGLSTGSVVMWNGQALPTTFSSATQLTAQVSKALLATAGTASVSVSTDGVSSNSLPFTINPALVITALTPASATPGSAFTLTVQGSGFTSGSSILWNGQALATTFGSATQLSAPVPSSLTGSAGTASITVSSADGVVSNALPLALSYPPLTGVNFTAPSTSPSGQNQTVTVNFGATYPADVVGTLTLTFAPQSGLPDDPAIQFQNNSRVYTFTVPAGTQPGPVQVLVSTGTVAGTITITPTFSAGGTNVTPAGTAPIVIQIAAAAPSLSTPTCTTSGSTFTVVVDGYTNTRSATQAVFTFQPKSGATLGTTQLTIPVTQMFSSWFGSAGAANVGGVFRYTQPFTVQGNLSTIGSVSLTLANATGTSAPVSCQLP